MNRNVGSPTKVLFFHIMRENFSGAQKNIFRLLINLDRSKITPVLMGQQSSPLTLKLEKEDIDVRITPYPKELLVFEGGLLRFNLFITWRFFKGLIKYGNSFYSELKQINPDVIWCDNIRTFVTLYIPAKFFGAKLIWNIWSEPKGKVAWLLHRMGLVLSDEINLEYSKQAIKVFGNLSKLQYSKNKITPLNTGVSDFEELQGTFIKEELGLSSDSIAMVMASNIDPLKGQLDLINSMINLKEEFSNVHLIIAGSPVESSKKANEYSKNIKEIIAGRKLGNVVHLLGWRTDVLDILNGCDIYVSSSYSESLPDIVREAMLASLPVVVTNVGGTADLVEFGKSGYIYEPGDSLTFEGHLKELFLSPEIRKVMGVRGKDIIDNKFSNKSYANKFEKMIRKLAHTKS